MPSFQDHDIFAFTSLIKSKHSFWWFRCTR